MKKCDTCIYRNNVEQLKPCIIYRDDCKLYERGNMTNDDAVNIIKRGLDNNSIDCFDIKQYMAIDMAIKALEQEPKIWHWTPVNERLPEDSGEYLITIKDRTYLEISWFYPSNKEWSYRNAEIVAWMPLPKPYEPQESEVQE